MIRKRRINTDTAEREVKTPRYLRRYKSLSCEEYLFTELLVLCHRTAAESYQLAFRSAGTLSSCAAAASRKVREPHISSQIELLSRYYSQNSLPVNEKYTV